MGPVEFAGDHPVEQHCLARDPADRPQSADEVARELLLGSTQPPPRDTRAAWLAAFAALFVPYFLWRWHYYGWLFPNTYYVKSSGAGAPAWGMDPSRGLSSGSVRT